MVTRGLTMTGLALALAACGGSKPAENVATPREAMPSGLAGGVTREQVATPTPTPSPTAAVQ